MQSSIKLGKLFGVEIGVHYSWFIIAALVAFSLGAQFSASNTEKWRSDRGYSSRGFMMMDKYKGWARFSTRQLDIVRFANPNLT